MTSILIPHHGISVTEMRAGVNHRYKFWAEKPIELSTARCMGPVYASEELKYAFEEGKAIPSSSLDDLSKKIAEELEKQGMLTHFSEGQLKLNIATRTLRKLVKGSDATDFVLSVAQFDVSQLENTSNQYMAKLALSGMAYKL